MASVVEPGSNSWIYNIFVDLLSYEIRLLNGIHDRGSDWNSYDNGNDNNSDNRTNLLSQKSKVNISVISC